MNHNGQYTIDASYKTATGCPAACLTGYLSKTSWAKTTEAKQKVVTQCELMASRDGKYTPYVQNYCCCAKAECFAADGKLKTGRRLSTVAATTQLQLDRSKLWKTDPTNFAVCGNKCTLPDSMTGTDTSKCVTTGGAIIAASCTLTCSSGYAGVPTVQCPTTNGKFVISNGCLKTKTVGTTAANTAATTAAATTTAAPQKKVKGETKLTLASVPADFKTNTKVKEALQEAIADTISIKGVTKDQVKIT